MNESGFRLQGDPGHLLRARPPVQAFYELDVWLLETSDVQIYRGVSLSLKYKLFPALENLRWTGRAEWVRLYSLESLAAGLWCGALDGLFLYRHGHRSVQPESPPQLVESLARALEVADGEWRQLDADALQLQAGYGKHLNRATEEENVEFLARPGAGDAQARRALAETFRTGYSLGLIDAAIVSLHGQEPERLD